MSTQRRRYIPQPKPGPRRPLSLTPEMRPPFPREAKPLTEPIVVAVPTYAELFDSARLSLTLDVDRTLVVNIRLPDGQTVGARTTCAHLKRVLDRLARE